MKKLLLTLCFLFTPLVSKADWVFVSYAPGWYLRTNGVENDGYGYYRVCSYCNSCYCYGGCYYVNGGALPAGNYQQATVSYSKGWKEKMIDALNTQKDNEMFLKSAQALGLQVDPQYQSQYAAYGYTANGLTTISQGFAAQGSTIYGLAAVPANPTIDVNTTIHEFQRGVDGVRDAMAQGYNLSASLNAQAIAGNVEAQTTAEVARGYAQALLANKTRTETQRWQTAPVQSAQPTPVNPSSGTATQPRPIEQPPSDPVPDTKGTGVANPKDTTMLRLKGGALWEGSCLKCHGDKGQNGAPNFTNLNSMGQQERLDLAKKVYARLTLPVDDKKHMPKGGPAFNDEQVTAVSSYVAP